MPFFFKVETDRKQFRNDQRNCTNIFFRKNIYFIFAIRFQVRSLHPNNKLADSIVYRHVHHLLLES